MLTLTAPAFFFDAFVLEGIVTVGCKQLSQWFMKKMWFLVTRDKRKILIWKIPESEVVAISLLFQIKFLFFK